MAADSPHETMLTSVDSAAIDVVKMETSQDTENVSAAANETLGRGRRRRTTTPMKKLPRLPFERPKRKRRKKVPLDASQIGETISNGTSASSLAVSVDQQQPSGMSSPNKPLKLVLKMASTGSYSPTIPNGGNNTNQDGVDDDDQPPPPLPLDDECSVEFFNSIKKTRKVKKKKKHHRHHHRHRNDGEGLMEHDDGQLDKKDDDDGGEEEEENQDVPATSNGSSENHQQKVSNNNHLTNGSSITKRIELEQVSTRTSSKRLSTAASRGSNNNNNNHQPRTAPNEAIASDQLHCSESRSSISSSASSSKENRVIFSIEEQQPKASDHHHCHASSTTTPSASSSSSSSSQYQQNTTARTQKCPKKNSSLYRSLLAEGVVKVDANNLSQQLALRKHFPNGERRKIVWSRSLEKRSLFQEFLHHLLRKLRQLDPKCYFAWPQIDLHMPGYAAVIKNPMDFDTIEKKIGNDLYASMQELKYDVRLMCENALKYHSQSGGQYRAASKLWQHAKHKVFAHCCVCRTLARHFPRLTAQDVGLAVPQCEGGKQRRKQQLEHAQSKKTETEAASSSLSSKTITLSSLLSDVRSEQKPSASASSSLVHLLTKHTAKEEEESGMRRELLADGLLGCANKLEENEEGDREKAKPLNEEQIRLELLAQFGANCNELVEPLSQRVTTNVPQTTTVSMARLEQDGTTSLGIVSTYAHEGAGLDTLAKITGDGLAALPEWKEPENTPRLKTVELVSTASREGGPENPFTSHLPLLDTSKANVTLAESQLLLNTFAQLETQFDETIEAALNDQDYLVTFTESVLNIITNGEYKTSARTATTGRCETEKEDMEVELVEDDVPNDKLLQDRLTETEKLLEQLRKVQHQRLASKPELCMPERDELELASQITHNLVEMIKQSTAPEHICRLEAIRKAMGVVVRPQLASNALPVNLEP